MNPVPIFFVIFTTSIGFVIGHDAVSAVGGLAVGVGIVLLANFLG